ncbi:probable cytochrome P450 301a1, mitochondrial [Uloborus diversus]|uniref:probable cytochrome P450 301a1, mitochondrial n=1 Tax=Uloborus diversus TaxID=327109 RepID=UPI00240964CC|nr:probable cytochrome P450 301a1, mitochondrial [Uloborus diversus]
MQRQQLFQKTTSTTNTCLQLNLLKKWPKIPMLPVLGSSWVYFPILGRYDKLRMHLADRHKNQTYGDVVREKIGKFELVFSFNPKDMETLVKYEGRYPVRTELASIKVYRESRKQWYKTMGVAILNGEEWWDLRSKAQKHLMKPKAIEGFLNPMQDVARDLVKNIYNKRDGNKEVPDFLKELHKWGIESVALAGLDTRLGALSSSVAPDSDALRLIVAIQTIFDLFMKLEPAAGNFPFWKYFPTPAWKRYVAAADTFTELAFKYINRALEALKSKSGNEDNLTLLENMLLKKELDPSAIMVMVADMLMAGVDTTSHTVAFLLYHLAKNPEKQKILFDELVTLFPNKGDKITPEIFSQLRYLKACIKESIRFDPVARGHGRTLDRDVVISGYRVPAKTFIIIALQQIYRNEKYFKNANQFWPERWLSKDDKPKNPFAYTPFGIGTRSCIGRRLAELEIICLSAEILRNFKVEYHHEDIGMITRTVNAPDRPLRLSFIDR